VNETRPFVLSIAERRRLHVRALSAQRKDQSEVCGVVVVSTTGRLHLVFMPNRSAEPGRYLLSTAEVRVQARRSRGRGERVLGTFHSHPISEATLSRGDLARGFFGGYELIYDVCGREFRLWRLRRGAGRAKKAVDVPLATARRFRARSQNQGEVCAPSRRRAQSASANCQLRTSASADTETTWNVRTNATGMIPRPQSW
jgi:proteasome lid subunit RPN8/RPN11